MTADAPVRPVSGDVLEERPSGPLQEVKPSARCHACGDGVVVAVCSRCARLLCPVHDSAAGPLGPRAILRLLRAKPDDETATTPPTTADKAKPNKVGVKERAADRGPHGAGSTADGAPANKKDRSAGEKADEPPGTDPAPAADPADGQAAGGDRTPSTDRARARRAPAGDEVSAADTPPASKRRKPERRRRERPRGAAQRHYCVAACRRPDRTTPRCWRRRRRADWVCSCFPCSTSSASCSWLLGRALRRPRRPGSPRRSRRRPSAAPVSSSTRTCGRSRRGS